jgi:hypothetical protein
LVPSDACDDYAENPKRPRVGSISNSRQPYASTVLYTCPGLETSHSECPRPHARLVIMPLSLHSTLSRLLSPSCPLALSPSCPLAISPSHRLAVFPSCPLAVLPSRRSFVTLKTDHGPKTCTPPKALSPLRLLTRQTSNHPLAQPPHAPLLVNQSPLGQSRSCLHLALLFSYARFSLFFLVPSTLQHCTPPARRFQQPVVTHIAPTSTDTFVSIADDLLYR